MVKLKRKVQAATIVESIVALLIIVTVITIALMICIQVSASNTGIKQLKAQGIIETAVLKFEEEEGVAETEQQFEGYKIEMEYEPSKTFYSRKVIISIFDELGPLIRTKSYIMLIDKK